MARQAVITDEQILEAARTIFMEEGFGAASSKIAKLAGVSEGTVFKRFHSKERLFCAALELDQTASWHQLALDRVGQGHPRENIADIAVIILRTLLDRMPKLVTLHGNPLHFSNAHPVHAMRQRDEDALSDYIKSEIRLKRLRPCDVELVTHLIFGALMGFTMKSLMERRPMSEREQRTGVDGTLSILWSGLAPEG